MLYLGWFACEDGVFCLEMAIWMILVKLWPVMRNVQDGLDSLVLHAPLNQASISLQSCDMHIQEVSLQPSHVKKMELYQVESEHVVVARRDWVSGFEIRERATEIGSPAFWKQICKMRLYPFRTSAQLGGVMEDERNEATAISPFMPST